jgi:membrane-bound lytic murein transglycosylase B
MLSSSTHYNSSKIGFWNIIMIIKKINTLAFSLLMLNACSTKDIKKDDNVTVVPTVGAIIEPMVEELVLPVAIETIPSNIVTMPVEQNVVPTHDGLSGDFSGNYKLENFITQMQTQYNFDRLFLYRLFSDAKDINQIVQPCIVRNGRNRCTTTIKPQGKWDRYRGMFIYERNIDRGVAFWNENENALNHAYQVYGVLPEYIIGILGVETAYGVNFGKKRVIDVLTSKAMLGDRRENFYTSQLEKFLIMTRDSNLDPSVLMGSNAGAMGYGQFIASSYLDFAVDFNKDGVTDLWNAEDAIGSIANYFSRNGWNRNVREVAVRAKYRGNRFRRLKTGYKTKYSQYKLRKKYAIHPRTRLSFKGPVSLIKLPKHSYDELWLGTHNFRVITTYNHSTFYGMAVFQLGQAVKARRYRQ